MERVSRPAFLFWRRHDGRSRLPRNEGNYCGGRQAKRDRSALFRTVARGCKAFPAAVERGARSCLNLCQNLRLTRLEFSKVFCSCHTHVLIRPSVVEEPVIALPRHALDEHHVGYLAGLLPLPFRLKDRLIAAIQNFSRIVPV